MNHKLELEDKNYSPFGIIPGSIKVANEKFAITKNVMTP
jgi:hypothetical protein